MFNIVKRVAGIFGIRDNGKKAIETKITPNGLPELIKKVKDAIVSYRSIYNALKDGTDFNRESAKNILDMQNDYINYTNEIFNSLKTRETSKYAILDPQQRNVILSLSLLYETISPCVYKGNRFRVNISGLWRSSAEAYDIMFDLQQKYKL